MHPLQSLLAALLITSSAIAAQPSASLPTPSTKASLASTVATGVPVALDSGREWYREVVLIGGVAAVLATFIFAMASKRDAA